MRLPIKWLVYYSTTSMSPHSSPNCLRYGTVIQLNIRTVDDIKTFLKAAEEPFVKKSWASFFVHNLFLHNLFFLIFAVLFSAACLLVYLCCSVSCFALVLFFEALCDVCFWKRSINELILWLIITIVNITWIIKFFL